ncbi:hypothetical protein P691DRAFT_800075 [Macrolepiota fuliginosa MF-IS2]|uniref:Uncharacterized protein n=1 Tax=Macrolepiota fuliginosa MF-IS2 TaxID=1400762 RepID=A0A9P6CBF2_9AGAR|nr:hypothetical protein P691DRAFT_800075 [Macrolepiota fuliginosa MF-IS2]
MFFTSRSSAHEPGHNNSKPSRGFLLGFGTSLLFAPLTILNLIAVHGASILRPYAPQLIPIAVCLFLVPVAVCLSIFAGWSVWKGLAVGWEVPLFLQYGERAFPYARVVVPQIQVFQPYDIAMHMALPVSESNISLGNFMATLTLLTSSNQTLATVSRPAILVQPKSSWFFGNPNVVNLHIKLLSSFVARASNVHAYVELGRQDGWKFIGDGRGREVSVLSASLRGTAIPHGISGLAIRFPLLASTFAAGIFLIILSAIIASCVLPTMFPVPLDQISEEEPKYKVEREPSPPSASTTRARGNSTALRRRRSKLSRRTSLSNPRLTPKTEEGAGAEVPVTLIPPAANLTEDAPDVSAHTLGSSTSTKERLKRRTSQKFDKSDEESHSESGE